MREIKSNLRRMVSAVTCTALLTAGGLSHAQDTYPDRPIKMLLGFAPGGGLDIIGRYLAQQLTQELGQPVVVENRAGASGSIAAAALIRAPADGYTLLLNGSSTLMAPILIKAPYDPVKDFEPVAQVGALVYTFAVHPDMPIHSMSDLVDAIRKDPGKYSYGSPGVGNMAHLAFESIKRDLDLDITHIPYKGGGPMLVDLVSGQNPIGATSMASLISLEKAGRVRVIGVTTKERSDLFPDVQVLSEVGLQPGFEAVSNVFLVAPAGTPKDEVKILNDAINKALSTQDAKDFFFKQGTLIRTGTPEDLRNLISNEVTQWGDLIRSVGKFK